MDTFDVMLVCIGLMCLCFGASSLLRAWRWRNKTSINIDERPDIKIGDRITIHGIGVTITGYDPLRNIISVSEDDYEKISS